MRKHVILLFCFLLSTLAAVAQNKSVNGVVVGASDGQPVVGASVIVKEMPKLGTSTNEKGAFALSVPSKGRTIVISAVGYAAQTVSIPSTGKLNIQLVAVDNELTEVVVTAMGIKKNRNQVAYATQKVDGAALSENRSFNVAQSLSGKVSGLQISQSNTMGGSTNVVIRGTKSITGNNQALFVIDNVPVGNTNINDANQQSGRGGYDFGNPASDINPDDIEDVQVLKGAAASGLYGSRGSNGVILITTKKGSKAKGLNITVNASVGLSAADLSTFAKYQNKYGAGYAQGDYSTVKDGTPNSNFLYRDANGDGVKDLIVPTYEDASYGAPFDPKLNVYQWDAFTKGSSNYGKATPWIAAKNGAAAFFEKPVSNTQSILMTNSYDKGSFKLGYSRDDQGGILPNSKSSKNIVSFGGTYKILDNLTASADINYYNIQALGRAATGYSGDYGDNPMTNFRQWWQTNVDLNDLKSAYFNSGGQNATWNFASPPNNLKPIFWNNPYFNRYQSYESDERNRYLGNVALNYKVNDWLNLMGRYSLDTYNFQTELRNAVGVVGVSGYRKSLQNYSERNIDFLANFDKDISDKFNLKAVLGTNFRRNTDRRTALSTNGGLVVPGIYALSNSVNALANDPLNPSETELNSEVNGVFAGATLSYMNYLTVEANIRRDQSSTLPKGSNSYYYPSVSGGFVFSELLKDQTWLNYGKVTANYAEVGNDAPVYSIHDTFLAGAPIGGQNNYAARSTKYNTSLKPERTFSKEVGLETQMFKNRLGFNASFYYSTTVDQILPIDVSTATGYLSKYINSGAVRNRGIELTLTGTPIKTKDFSWDVTVNWTRNRNKVLSLYTDAATGRVVDNVQITTFQQGVSYNATVGQPLGVLKGSDYVYLNGQRVINGLILNPETGKMERGALTGRYKISDNSNNNIGNVNPDWIGGINNKFKYKNISLSFLIDAKKGGSVFSLDQAYGLATGLYPVTAANNELGNPSRNSLETGGGVLFPGVLENGTQNNFRADNNTTYGTFGYTYNPNKTFIYDASFVKLREVVLGYELPQKLVSKLGPVKGVDISFAGRNLWVLFKNTPYSDPESGTSFGNISGFQVGTYPNIRSFTFNFKFRF